jgi:hypothetical protein
MAYNVSRITYNVWLAEWQFRNTDYVIRNAVLQEAKQ